MAFRLKIYNQDPLVKEQRKKYNEERSMKRRTEKISLEKGNEEVRLANYGGEERSAKRCTRSGSN